MGNLCVAFLLISRRYSTPIKKFYLVNLTIIVYKVLLINGLKRNRKQYVSINVFKSNTSTLTCGVPQASVLGPILFVIHAIGFCHVHHFSDDTSLLHINRFPKMLNKLIKYDLNNLSNCLCQQNYFKYYKN